MRTSTIHFRGEGFRQLVQLGDRSRTYSGILRALPTVRSSDDTAARGGKFLIVDEDWLN